MGTVENQQGQDIDDNWVKDRKKEFEELIDSNHDGIVTMEELEVSKGVGLGAVGSSYSEVPEKRRLADMMMRQGASAFVLVLRMTSMLNNCPISELYPPPCVRDS